KIKKITKKNLQLIYTPGVAAVCKEIFNHPNTRYQLTSKANNVAIVT
ncbi:MAG: NAD-dependent malic enzyme, partial [Nitrosopumilus sp. CG10_big_fil_rev_8_21_14_0_10_33_7]